jgi:hypothetical protein
MLCAVQAGTVVAVIAFVAGLVIVVSVLASSVITVVLPRGVRTRIGRFVFTSMRLLFKLRIRSSTSYENRDRTLALYAPLSLLALLGTWVVGLFVGYTALLWSVGAHPLRAAFTMSGGSLTTLGLRTPRTLPQIALALSEAILGLGELALLITFLPNIYSDYHRRERDVTKLRTAAGSPPEGVNILIRLHNLERLDARTEIWVGWTDWFVDTEQTHSAFPALAFFRSMMAEFSWVTASGAILDGASLAASCLDLSRDYEAELCIRTGYLFLRRIAALFNLPHATNPAPTDPIAVTRDEFDEVWRRMADAGMPLKDPDQSWRDFKGWRVNYDEVLIRLANLTEAPIAPWSSDRGLVDGRRLTFIERIRQ